LNNGAGARSNEKIQRRIINRNPFWPGTSCSDFSGGLGLVNVRFLSHQAIFEGFLLVTVQLLVPKQGPALALL